MSTRSYIGIAKPDNTVEYVYCHSDGYPEYVGELLQKYYTDSDTVQNLIDHGDMSWLGKTIGNYNKFPDNFSSDKPNYQVCCFYGRDRGERNTAKQTASLEKYSSLNDIAIEYEYLYRDNRWYVRDVPWKPGKRESFIPLETVLG